jgi:hypothetical protein
MVQLCEISSMWSTLPGDILLHWQHRQLDASRRLSGHTISVSLSNHAIWSIHSNMSLQAQEEATQSAKCFPAWSRLHVELSQHEKLAEELAT